jgi:hypothetical protein
MSDLVNHVDAFGFEKPDWLTYNKGLKTEFFIGSDGAEMVRIRAVADTLSAPVLYLDDKLKERFSDQYAKWKSGDDSADGTSLSQWGCPPDIVKQFEADGVETVQDLAAISDNFVGRVMGGRQWRAKAKDWLEKAGARADHTSLERANADLLARIEALTAEVDELKGRKK